MEVPTTRAPPRVIDTILFVDVDGVLNVGVRDDQTSSLLLSRGNLARAKRYLDTGVKRLNAERLVGVYLRRAQSPHGEKFSALVSESDSELSEVLVARLSELITTAGQGCKVVLSSDWRLPENAARKVKLEAAISRHLAKKFSFDCTTRLVREFDAEGRANSIGDAIEKLCSQRASLGDKIRVLVLDDFFASSLGTWSCRGSIMNSVEDIEKFLRLRAPPDLDIELLLVHTHESWNSEKGFLMQVGTGLTEHHFRKAMAFLERQPKGDEGSSRSIAASPANALAQGLGIAVVGASIFALLTLAQKFKRMAH